jgi:hypothetical protein
VGGEEGRGAGNGRAVREAAILSSSASSSPIAIQNSLSAGDGRPPVTSSPARLLYSSLQNVYRPRMFVIIGRQGVESPTVARAVEADMPDICLRTYDDVLRRAKWKLERMKGRAK